MHKDISVAVPTRHRPECLNEFVRTFNENTNTKESKRPYLTILHDSPKNFGYLEYEYDTRKYQEVVFWDKSSLTELWNWSIITAPTDWVLICNDDIVFKPGWLEYLETTIATGKYLQINLGHYGAFCMHKSLILKMGWHDERYRGGGYEDIDWQLRLNEAGIKDMVDNSHTFYKNDPGHDVGHFIDHYKSGSNEGWQGCNNQQWICEKWGRRAPAHWNRIPSVRMKDEPDWHPTYTRKYSEKYNMNPDYIMRDGWKDVWGGPGVDGVYP